MQIVGTQMAEGMRIAALRAGRDPRRHALLSFGGAAGLHVAQIACNLEIDTVIIPPAASVFSAWGMLESDMRYERVRNVTRVLDPGTSKIVEDVISAMRQELVEQIGSAPNYSAKIYLNMRYGEQIFEIPVEFDHQEFEELRNEANVARRSVKATKLFMAMLFKIRKSSSSMCGSA